MKNLNKILCLLLFVLLTGCSLAQVDKKEKEEDKINDVKIGVFVTVGEEEQNKLTEKNKIYAEVIKDKDDYNDFKFKDLNGLYILNYYYSLKDFDATEGLLGANNNKFSDKEINSINGKLDMETVITDSNLSKTKTNASVYFTHKLKNKSFYLNPIYETEDGSVYVSSESGINLENTTDLGLVGNINQTSEFISKDQVTYRFEFYIHFYLMNTPVSYKILEMDQNHHIINSTEYKLNEIPQEYTPKENTQYITVEQSELDNTNKLVTSNSIYDKEKNQFYMFECDENYICTKKSVTINWQNK